MIGAFLVAPKVLFFLGGAAAVIVGKKVINSEKARQLCVKGLAQGMILQDCAKEALQNIKEDAQDIYHDAKKQADQAE